MRRIRKKRDVVDEALKRTSRGRSINPTTWTRRTAHPPTPPLPALLILE
jgi:hypothetical protein